MEQESLRLLPQRTGVTYQNVAPAWIRENGLAPRGMDRIAGIDFSTSDWFPWPKRAMMEPHSAFEFIGGGSPNEPLGDTEFMRLIPHLQRLKHLRSLNLGGTNITDRVIAELKYIRQLDFLSVGDTRVSEAALRTFAAWNPRTSIYYTADGDQNATAFRLNPYATQTWRVVLNLPERRTTKFVETQK